MSDSRPLQAGDRVTAVGTVRDALEGWVRVLFDDAETTNIFTHGDIQALTLIAPAEPPIGSVVVKGGVAWVHVGRFENGHVVRDGWYEPLSGIFGTWDDGFLHDGDIVYQPQEGL